MNCRISMVHIKKTFCKVHMNSSLSGPDLNKWLEECVYLESSAGVTAS